MLVEKFFTWRNSKFSYFLYVFQVPNSNFLIFLYKYSNKHSMFSHYMFVMLLFLWAIITGDDWDGWSLIIQDPTLGNLVEFALNLSSSCTGLNEWMNLGEASAGSTANKIGQDMGWQMCSKLHLDINIAHFGLVIMSIVICKMLISIGGPHTDFWNAFAKC